MKHLQKKLIFLISRSCT